MASHGAKKLWIRPTADHDKTLLRAMVTLGNALDLSRGATDGVNVVGCSRDSTLDKCLNTFQEKSLLLSKGTDECTSKGGDC